MEARRASPPSSEAFCSAVASSSAFSAVRETEAMFAAISLTAAELCSMKPDCSPTLAATWPIDSRRLDISPSVELTVSDLPLHRVAHRLDRDSEAARPPPCAWSALPVSLSAPSSTEAGELADPVSEAGQALEEEVEARGDPADLVVAHDGNARGEVALADGDALDELADVGGPCREGPADRPEEREGPQRQREGETARLEEEAPGAGRLGRGEGAVGRRDKENEGERGGGGAGDDDGGGQARALPPCRRRVEAEGRDRGPHDRLDEDERLEARREAGRDVDREEEGQLARSVRGNSCRGLVGDGRDRAQYEGGATTATTRPGTL